MCVNRNLRLENDSLLMPKLGRVRITPLRPVPADWTLKSATLTIERDHTVYVSVCFEYEDDPVTYTPDPRKAVGLDYKSDGFYADSEGNVCGSSKYARKAQDLLTKQQRKLRHKKKGFRNGRATMDNGYGMFLRFLEYKLHDRGKVFIKVSRWFPSSQICHECGKVDPELKDMRIRHWTCPVCGSEHDRDINAAINILQEGLRLYRQHAA